jgi:WhiB family redox-sensing transcriptional regulator
VNVISAALELVDMSGGLTDPVEETTATPLRLVDPTGAAVGVFGEPEDAQEADWQERALCAQTDPEAFFPEKGGSTREAKRICSGCEVRAECLEYALAHDERFGIWGGLSERERRRLRRAISTTGATRPRLAGIG